MATLANGHMKKEEKKQYLNFQAFKGMEMDAPGASVQVWSVDMHFNVKGFKTIKLHSNFPTFLQHFTKEKLDIGRFV